MEVEPCGSQLTPSAVGPRLSYAADTLKKVLDMAFRGVANTFVPKPDGLGYAEAMSQLRMWLDSRKVQPADFKITAGRRIGFEISFSSEHDAQVFELFEWTQK